MRDSVLKRCAGVLTACMPGWLAMGAVLTVLVAAGCAATHSPPAPASGASVPDESLLAPAEKALSKAQAAHAGDFAPQVLSAARHRLTLARGMLFNAARAGRPPTSREKTRIKQLVSAARLDARSALVQTQAGAVAVKLKQLRPSTRTASASRAQKPSSLSAHGRSPLEPNQRQPVAPPPKQRQRQRQRQQRGAPAGLRPTPSGATHGPAGGTRPIGGPHPEGRNNPLGATP